MLRTAAGIEYELTRKAVKNFNLRIGTDGTVRVSAPRRVPVTEIDRFVASRTDWISAARVRMKRRAEEAAAPEQHSYTAAECLAAFTAVSDRIYPQFAAVVPVKPEIRVRDMKSRWGVCHIRGHYITLNTRLMNQPPEALEYVIVHEYVHFLHPNHQAGFHAEMAKRMPDYRARRAMLR